MEASDGDTGPKGKSQDKAPDGKKGDTGMQGSQGECTHIYEQSTDHLHLQAHPVALVRSASKARRARPVALSKSTDLLVSG